MSSLSLHRALVAPMKAAGLVRLMMHWAATRRSRTALARLDTHLLHDIGLEPRHVRQELRRPFWSL